MEIPAQHQRAVIPHILVEGAAKAIEFYTAAFGAQEYIRLEEQGRIVHAEIGIQGSTLMLGDAEPPLAKPPATGPSVILHVYVEDVDALTVQAVAAGAELLAEPADMTYGMRQSMLRDPFGHLWIFLSPLASPSQ